MNPEERLCLSCGMCCDGSLFDNVQLGSDEDGNGIRALGLLVRLSRAKKPVAHFLQPCRALQSDCRCRVYADRPKQCRAFECQVFKDLKGGTLSLEKALGKVKRTRRQADKVRALLRQMGEGDEALSISKRFRRVQRWLNSDRAEALSGEVYAELGLAIHKFDLLAHRDFYTVEE